MNLKTPHTNARNSAQNNAQNTALTRAAANEGQLGLATAGGVSPQSSSSAAGGVSPQYRAPVKHSMLRRKSGHDYTQPAAYLITVETTDRQRLLGTLDGDNPDAAHIVPTELGTAVIDAFRDIENKVREKTGCRVQILQYQLMPDHFHGILYIRDALPSSWHLGKIVGAWKGFEKVNLYL